ncbi:hypothetical protein IW261DRAFT_1567980 [Armillaria novae-zelandiae]|uniref:Uncharacterized protein n=1 Tax=Armillaria novae-zelandiae TaxID=153914 RepID=A0AA39P0Y6_9AGAR|nr:hypothetical protein IW261DRAFT_1567930 [Armillaria novae-zelandiae]KAK0475580.1 hypothetical protein IW261DRAFT_1567980 [Armillaria novae-zelandiae]
MNSILFVISKTLKHVRRAIHQLFGNLVDNPDLDSSTFPPSYDVVTRTPPPYSAIDTVVQNDTNMIDTVEPAPPYNVEYSSTPLEDVGMAGFLRSRLATIFEEDEDEAVE